MALPCLWYNPVRRSPWVLGITAEPIVNVLAQPAGWETPPSVGSFAVLYVWAIWYIRSDGDRQTVQPRSDGRRRYRAYYWKPIVNVFTDHVRWETSPSIGSYAVLYVWAFFMNQFYPFTYILSLAGRELWKMKNHSPGQMLRSQVRETKQCTIACH